MQPGSAINPQALADAVKLIITENLWTLLACAFIAVVTYIFKDDLKDRYAGYKWRRNVEYRRLDKVYFYEWQEVGVIEYIAKVETAFTMYMITFKDDVINVHGGRSIVIPNAELQDMHIARFKPQIGNPGELPDFIIEDVKRKAV